MKVNCKYTELVAEIPGYNRYVAHRDGYIISKKDQQQIKQIQRKDGYINVHVLKEIVDGKKKYQLKLEHRLIALAFLGESKLDVNHKNGDKSDNRIENLEFMTRSQNIRHSIDVLKNSHVKSGFESAKSKITKDQHDKIYRWHRDGVLKPRELAKFFEVNQATIMNHLRKHKTIWKQYQ